MECCFRNKYKEKRAAITKENVLFLPELNGNPFSITKTEQSGFQVCFKDRKVIVKRSNQEVLLAAKCSGRLYKVEGARLSIRLMKTSSKNL